MATVLRRSARVVLVDDEQHLVLIKRTRPGLAPYWVTVGGGVESEDSGVEAALHREVFEELGAKIDGAQQVFIVTDRLDDGIGIQHFFVARLVSMDISARTGTEFTQPERGDYEIVRVPLTAVGIAQVNLMPPQAAEFISANAEGLLALAADPQA